MKGLLCCANVTVAVRHCMSVPTKKKNNFRPHGSKRCVLYESPCHHRGLSSTYTTNRTCTDRAASPFFCCVRPTSKRNLGVFNAVKTLQLYRVMPGQQTPGLVIAIPPPPMYPYTATNPTIRAPPPTVPFRGICNHHQQRIQWVPALFESVFSTNCAVFLKDKVFALLGRDRKHFGCFVQNI